MKKDSFSARCAPSSQLEPERCDPIMKKTGARGSLTVETLAETVASRMVLLYLAFVEAGPPRGGDLPATRNST